MPKKSKTLNILKITRSTASKRQQQGIDSLVSVSSPVKCSKCKEVNSPECKKQAAVVVVTETKQKHKSSDDKNSKESDLISPQAKMSAPF